MPCRPRPDVVARLLAILMATGLVSASAWARPVSSQLGDLVAVGQERPPRQGPQGSGPDLDGPPRGGIGDDDRRDGRGAGPRRRLSPEQIDAIVEVAGEVFPDGGARLRELRERDPEALERVLGRQARRLFTLAMLRQRNPELYALKLEELRNQMELRTLAARHEELQAQGDSAAAQRDEIQDRIRSIAERQVDLGLRVRGLELAAMDEAIRRMRAELATDAENREAAVAEMVELVLSGRELPVPEIRPESGGRGMWNGRNGSGRSERLEEEGSNRRPRGPGRPSPPTP
jgi:hypothetical protein